MRINGTALATVLIVPSILAILSIGSLYNKVYANEKEQDKQEQEIRQATIDVATIQTDMKNVKETLIRLENQSRIDKKELLDAINAQ